MRQLSPWAPKRACPQCRRVGCVDPAHKPKPFKTAAPTVVRRPEYVAQRKRRRAVVKAWLGANAVTAEDGKRVAQCPECGHWTSRYVADHIVPVALGGSESGEMRVHCLDCSRRQGGVVSNAKRKVARKQD